MLIKITIGVAALLTAMPATAQNLITNPGFEGGYTSPPSSSAQIPTGWTPNAAAAGDSFITPTPFTYHTGSHSLQIGNFDTYAVDVLSQTFSDVAGAVYNASFYGMASQGGDPLAYLTVSAGGTSVTFLDNINSFTQGTFTFTGSGSDTLSIAARTNPGEWFVDDVSVTAGASSPIGAVPEPAAWMMMIAGFGIAGAAFRRRRSVVTSPLRLA